MPRAIWTGSISFGLVNVPVKLFTATEDRSVGFPSSTPRAGSGSAASGSYALLREAMKESNRVAIARFVMRAKQSLAAIRVAPSDGDAGDVLVLETMHFGDEVRSPADIRELEVLADGIEIDDRERAAAKRLVESLTSDWDPDQYTDTYRERVLDLVARKADGERIVTEKAEEPEASVTDLMAVLEASLNEARQKRGEAPNAASTPASARTDYASMAKDELYEEAQRRDIDGRSKMTKEQLVAALSDAEHCHWAWVRHPDGHGECLALECRFGPESHVAVIACIDVDHGCCS